MAPVTVLSRREEVTGAAQKTTALAATRTSARHGGIAASGVAREHGNRALRGGSQICGERGRSRASRPCAHALGRGAEHRASLEAERTQREQIEHEMSIVGHFYFVIRSLAIRSQRPLRRTMMTLSNQSTRTMTSAWMLRKLRVSPSDPRRCEWQCCSNNFIYHTLQ